MAIQDRNLSAGTQLVAKYKGQTFLAEVIEEHGELRYQLAGGQTFKSPSSMGKAVLGGKSCNGWAFWSLANAEQESPTTEAPPPAPTTRSGTPVPKPQPKPRRGKQAKADEPEAEEAAAAQPEATVDDGYEVVPTGPHSEVYLRKGKAAAAPPEMTEDPAAE